MLMEEISVRASFPSGQDQRGIEMVHLLDHMQTGIHTGRLHLVVSIDNIGIEDFPCACKKVDGRQTLHSTIIKAV